MDIPDPLLPLLLSFIASGRSSGLHPVSSHSCCMFVWAGRPAFVWPYAGVYRSTSLMSSSLLLQQCPACLVSLTCIVFVTGGRWPYSWCLVGCCLFYHAFFVFDLWKFYYFDLLRVLLTSISWWSFTSVRMTASLLRSPRLFSILANLSRLVVWMISILPVFFSKSLETATSTQTKIGITVTLMFHILWQGPNIFFIFTLWSTKMAKSIR